jgi:putative membrane protein
MLVDDRIPWGQVMWRHSGSLVVILVLATAVCFLDAYLGPDQPLMPPLTLPMSLLGVAVCTFLGFRNNNAYDRFWEGRKLWGGIINFKG